MSAFGKDSLQLGEPVPLTRLAPGARGVIEAVDGTNRIGRRLLDLGFAPHTPVRVVRRAPLGDPVSYELRGTRICLRSSEAARVLVRPSATNGQLGKARV
jgi:Fe2+ transport system protein FeoA